LIRVILGLGSNLGNREANLYSAIQHLSFLQNIRLSSFYRSKALLPSNAPPEWDIEYINSAISGDTDLPPETLLKKIQEIEQLMGRPKLREKWAPRIIDIDILMYGDFKVNTRDLIIPHPELLKRDFALKPAQEIEPDMISGAFNRAS